MTDQAAWYPEIGGGFAGRYTVNHSADEYVRYTNAVQFPSGKPFVIHTNSVEGYYSIFKRGMIGVYQWCAEKHLHRYLAEYDYRYSNRVRLGVDDVQRTELAFKGAVGKRLTIERLCTERPYGKRRKRHPRSQNVSCRRKRKPSGLGKPLVNLAATNHRARWIECSIK